MTRAACANASSVTNAELERPWDSTLLSAGLILFETSRIVTGGETNYVLATVGLYVSIFNLFTSLLSLFGFGSSDE
jgi:FtsH-binding integral membrane protein